MKRFCGLLQSKKHRRTRDDEDIFDVLFNGFFFFLLFGWKASLFIVCTLSGHKIDGGRYSGDRDDIISMARGNGLAISGQRVEWDGGSGRGSDRSQEHCRRP